MFALHKVVEGKLYALVTNELDDGHEQSDALHDLFENWQDVSYIHRFFKKNQAVLSYLGLSRPQAIEQVLHESKNFYSALLEATNSDDFSREIDKLFEPLHKNPQTDVSLLQLKAYGGATLPSITRIYAIKLKDNAIVIVGGLIKSSQALQNTKDGKELLNLIKQLTRFLNDKKLIDSKELQKITRITDLYE
ncbi:MAG: hypothetical protein R2809_05150 [Flavobacteriales bacterium]